ncbi:hypothetical protein Dimus_039231 [Dionaea muscipula]
MLIIKFIIPFKTHTKSLIISIIKFHLKDLKPSLFITNHHSPENLSLRANTEGREPKKNRCLRTFTEGREPNTSVYGLSPKAENLLRLFMDHGSPWTTISKGKGHPRARYNQIGSFTQVETRSTTLLKPKFQNPFPLNHH